MNICNYLGGVGLIFWLQRASYSININRQAGNGVYCANGQKCLILNIGDRTRYLGAGAPPQGPERSISPYFFPTLTFLAL